MDESNSTKLPIPITPENVKLIHAFRLTLSPQPDYKDHKAFSVWQTQVNELAEQDLFKRLNYVPSIHKMPRNFNLHLLLNIHVTSCYDEITEYLSRHPERFIQYEHASEEDVEERLQCACSQNITELYFITGHYGKILTGCDCITKNNFVEMTSLQYVRERDMSEAQRTREEEKKRIAKEKREEKKHIAKQEEERKQEEQRKELAQRVEAERIQKEKQKQENIEKSICNACLKPFRNQGKYELCYSCKPKCECGTILTNPKFKKCFECNQQMKKDICIGCKKFFDGKGKYKNCYDCN